jgi:hypothetical protein
MKLRVLLRAALLAIAAVLALASPALAKGGGGGGGSSTPVLKPVSNPCATIESWTNSLETINDELRVVMRIDVVNSCVDEGTRPDKMPALSLTRTDTATGTFQSASVYMVSYGRNTYTFYGSYVPVEQAAPSTLTASVARNGKLEDSRSMTVAEVLSSVQPAA